MGFGDLVAASFPLPQNPIMAPTSMDRAKILTPGDTRNALMRSLTAQRTGPVSSTVGMGDASSVLQSTGQFLDSTIAIAGFDVPYWALAAAAGALLIFMGTGKPGKNRYQRVKAAIAPA